MSYPMQSEKLYTLSTGDPVYRYEKTIVIFFKGQRKVLSTSIFNGGYHEDYTAVYNHDGKVGAGMPCEMLAPTYTEHMQILSRRLGLDPDRVTGMGTAADMENAVIETLSYKNLTVTAIVTGGIETNGGRVGDPADYFKPLEKPNRPGTINIMLVLDTDLPPGTLARALVTCTEAKTAAIQELMEGSKYSTGLATGSGTDTTIVVANSESSLYLEGAGKHSKLGELIGRAVKAAVKKALDKQSGLNPQNQHNVLRRLQRFHVSTATLWKRYLASFAEGENFSSEGDTQRNITAKMAEKEKQGENRKPSFSASAGSRTPLLKPEFLERVEKLAKEDVMVTYTTLYIHLLDQYLWELVSEEETREAGEMLLRQLRSKYGVKADKKGFLGRLVTVETMMEAWEELFLACLEQCDECASV